MLEFGLKVHQSISLLYEIASLAFHRLNMRDIVGNWPFSREAVLTNHFRAFLESLAFVICLYGMVWLV